MGCCTSAAADLADPGNRVHRVRQITTPNQQIEPTNPMNIDQEEIVEEQTKVKEMPQKKPRTPPCKRPRPIYEGEEQIQYVPIPKVETVLMKLIKYGRELRDSAKVNSELENQLILEIEDKIFDKTLDLDYLNQLCLQHEKQINEILFLKGCQGLTILEEVLIYIDNFDIIRHLLQENSLPKGDDLYFIAKRLISKILPARKSAEKIKLSIQFLKQIKDSEQMAHLMQQQNFIIFSTEFRNVQSEFNLKNRLHVKLLKHLVSLLEHYQVHSTIKEIYNEAKRQDIFTSFKLPKSIPTGESNISGLEIIELKELSFNIFHQMSQSEKWDLFLNYSNPYYQQPNVSGLTPFMIMFQKAPLDFIIKYISKYPNQLNEAVKYTTKTGLNIIHCFSKNKNFVNEAEVQQFIDQFNTLQIQKLLIQPYFDQIPLVYYLDCQKQPLANVCSFLSQNITKEFNTFDFMIQSYNINKEKKKFHKQRFCNHLQQLPKLHRKQEKFLKENLLTEDYSSFEILYTQYIQLVKQLIKRNFSIQFDWVNKFDIFTCYFPYETGTVQQTFMNILIRNGLQDQVKETITKMNTQYESQIKLGNISLRAQFIATLICLKKELKLYPYKVSQLIDTLIIDSITESPKLLVEPLYGNFDFKKMETNSIYALLLQLNDKVLNEACLSVQMLFDLNEEISERILKQVITLKLQHSKDHVLKKIIDQIPNVGKIMKFESKQRAEIATIVKKGEILDNEFHLDPQLILQIYKFNRFEDIVKRLLQIEGDKFEFATKFNMSTLELVVREALHYPEQMKKMLNCFKTFKPLLWVIWQQTEITFNPAILIEHEIAKRSISIFKVNCTQFEQLFNWQLAGVNFKFYSKNIEISKQLNEKEKVIQTQLNQDVPFVIALLQYDQFNKEVEQQLSERLMKEKTLKIREMLDNKAYQNIQSVSTKLNLNANQLIEILAIQYFKKDNNKNMEEILRFNEQVIILNNLIKNNPMDEKSQVFCPIQEFISYLSSETYCQLRQEVKTQLIDNSQVQITQVIEQCQNLKLKQLIVDDIESIIKNKKNSYFQFLEICVKIQAKDKSLTDFILQKITKEKQYCLPIEDQEKEVTKIKQKIYQLFFSAFTFQEEIAIKYLDLMDLSINNWNTLYCQALKKQSINTLNLLLIYAESKELQLNKLLLKAPSTCSDDILNYYKAMEHPYYLVLNIKQYQLILNTKEVSQQMKLNHFKGFLLHGLFEKLQLVMDNYKFEDYENELIFTIKKYLSEKLQMNFESSEEGEHENDLQSETNYKIIQFFDLPENNTVRKQVRYLDGGHNQVKQVRGEKNGLERKRLLQQNQHKLRQFNFNQKQQYSMQNCNQSSLFVVSSGQKSDFEKCINSIHNQILAKKQKSKEDFSNYELYYSIIKPEAKKIQKSQAIIDLLIKIFENVKKPNKFVASRYDDYIKLFRSNQKGVTFDDLQGKISPFQKQFRLELLLSSQAEDKNEIANKILQERHEDPRCVKYLTSNLKDLEKFQFNSTTLYYTTQKVNLLKDKKQYDLSGEDSLKRRLTYLQPLMTTTDFDLSNMNNVQVFLSKGRHDHIQGKIQFNQGYLVAAMLSNNIHTIMYVMNLHKNPKLLGFEQNVFQILMIFQCEKNIVTYFNTYMNGFVKDFSRYLILNNVPTLYYVLFNRQEKIFKEIILSSLVQQHGLEKAQEIIRNELKKETPSNEYKVYQIGLLRKCYFILDYLEGIIQPNDIDIVNFSFTYYKPIEEKQSKNQIFCSLYSQSLPLCTQEIIWKNSKKSNKKLKQQDDVNNLTELIKLEQVCLNKLFGFENTIKFKNRALQLQLEDDKLKVLKMYKYSPQLVCQFLEVYRTKNGVLSIKPDIMEKIVPDILNEKIIHEEIFCELVVLNPLLFLEKIKPIYVTLEVATLFFIFLKDQPGFLQYVQHAIEIYYQSNHPKEQLTEEEIEESPSDYIQPKVIYMLVLLCSISEDNYEKKQLQELNVKTAVLLKVLEVLQRYQNSKQNINLSEKTLNFIQNVMPYKITYDDQIVSLMIQNVTSIEQGVIRCLIYFRQIEAIIDDLQVIIKPYLLQNKINFNYFIKIGDGDLVIHDDQILILLNFDGGSFQLHQKQMDQAETDIKKLCQTFFFEQQKTSWDESFKKEIPLSFDFDSVVTANFEDSEFSTCLNKLKSLTQLLNYVGEYQIDDIFAPHQHESVRQPELTQQISLQREPSLKRQSSSVQGTVLNSLSLQKPQSINSRQQLKEDYQFMLELLPDNTYQVRKKTFKVSQKELIFPEFYNFVQPRVKLLLNKLNEADFNSFTQRTIISILIQDLYKYNEFIGKEIEGMKSEEWIIDFPYYVKNQKLIIHKCLFSTYNIQYIYTKLYDYIETVRKLVEDKKEVQKIVWRINAISFMEVFVSKLVNELESQQIPFRSIYSLIDMILNWRNLTMILNTLIYHNLAQAQQVLKVIRGLYIEFNEVHDLTYVDLDYKEELDDFFQFGTTTYLLNNHVLIIRINVQAFPMQVQKTQKQPPTTLTHQIQSQQYFHSILNLYDFYNQIFSAEQLVSFIFNKLEIDRELLQFSNKLSQELKKTVTISVDHTSLGQIFQGEIQRAMQNKKDEIRLRDMEEIWYILNKLRLFFKTDLLRCLINQLRADSFQEMFNIRLASMINALRFNIPLHQLIASNTRKLQPQHPTPVLERISNLARKISVNLTHQIGFQLVKSFYVNNTKLGDVTIIIHYEDQKITLTIGQLVCNSKPGQLVYAKLAAMQTRLFSLYLINRNQAIYQQVQASNKEFALIYVEDIYSAVILTDNWPSDPMFNQCILNIFFMDQEGYLSICNEPKFLTSMIEIQNEQDEIRKQELLDDLFGVGLVSAYSDLTITQMTPIFPDSINIDFQSANQLRKQQSLISGKNCSIFIDGDKFELSPIEMQNVSFACYFESNVQGQKLQGQFIEFINRNQEFKDVTLHFNNMNENANEIYGRLVSSSNFPFLTFKNGYEIFLQEQAHPRLYHSLQYFFGVQSIKFIKKDLMQKAIERVEFIFEINLDSQTLIELKDRVLRIYTSIEDKIIRSPSSEEITFYFNDLIIKQENSIQDILFESSQLQIKFNPQIDIENVSSVIDLILLSKYLNQMIQKIEKVQVLTIHLLSSAEAEKQYRGQNYYFTEKGEVRFNLAVFSDFDLDQLLLDYLNFQIGSQNQKAKNLIYKGPDIIFEPFEFSKDQLFQCIDDQIQESKLMVISDTQHDQLNPKEFQEAIMLLQADNVYSKLISIKSCENKLLKQYFAQKSSCTYDLGDSVFVIINQMKPNLSIETQLNKIKVKLIFGWSNRKKILLSQLLYEQTYLAIRSSFITQNSVLLEIKSDKKVGVQLFSNQKQLSLIKNQISTSVAFQYETKLEQDLAKTQHISITYNNKQQKVELEKDELLTYTKRNVQLMKTLMKQVNNKNFDSLAYKNVEPMTHSKDLQAGNTINILSNHDAAAATRAGGKRIDYIEFKDTLGNTLVNFSYKSIVFVHSIFYQIQYIPEEERFDEGLNLIWTPTFKGVYKLYIDDMAIKGRFIVLADQPDIANSLIEMPKDLETVPFYEMIVFSFSLKDKYENVYGDTEKSIYSDSQCEIIKVKSQQTQINTQYYQLSKTGQLNVQVVLEPDDMTVLEDSVAIEFLINHKLKHGMLLTVKGLSLDKRRNKFQEEVNKIWKPRHYNLNISRMNFLQDLLLLAEEKMNFTFSIKFHNEPGIDAGGLKREFYDMIGNTLKDEQYKFFTPVQANQTKYFLNHRFNKLKNKEQYALLFGKLIANAIANTYLIGIDLIVPFWKVVYNQQIVFDDLKQIWDEATFNNYEGMKKMSTEEIESISLDFTYQIGNQQIELVPNGAKISVTKKNLDLYLNKTAEYLIQKQFAAIYKSFIEGFQMVLDISICAKWMRPQEMSLLTQGLLEIKPDVILSKIQITGGKAQHKSYFETYVSQADPVTLKNMLKFITGSSSIPFDQSTYVIGVQFRNNLDQRKLPISHTCFKTIEVPLYSTYAQLKQKLDIAFTIGIEGFGFG